MAKHGPASLRRRAAAQYLLQVLAAAVVAGCGQASLGVAPPATSVAAGRVLASPPTPAPIPATSPPLAITETPAPTAPPATAPILPTAVPTAAPLSAAAREEIFLQVWQTVRDNYLYIDYRGVDWVGLRDRYMEQVRAAEDDDAFYAAMSDLVAQLSDQHSRFVPPSEVLDEDAFSSGRELSAGIGVLTVPGLDGAFIQQVYADSPAARAGLRPRDRIIAVDNRAYRPEDGDLQGMPGTSVRLSVVRPGDRPRDVVLVRQEITGRLAPYYRRFPGDIGYVAVSTLWVNDMGEQVSGALTELVVGGKLNGLILDLRGNRGGWGHVMDGILGHFVRGQVGLFFDRKQVRPLVISAPAGPDLRGLRERLVVLVDEDTASYAEVIAAVLQHEAGATVVGVPSSGNTETIYAHALADGSRLWLAQEGFRLQDGLNLEGRGVEPNYVVDIDWKRFSEDDDPQLLEALRLLGAGPK